MKLIETDLKRQVKDYLAYKGIFSFPLIQGIASYKGAPDRVIHLNGRVVYLEIKLPKGKMSEWQLAFQEQCQRDGVEYYIIRSLEDLQAIVECPKTALGCDSRGIKAKSSGIMPVKKKRGLK